MVVCLLLSSFVVGPSGQAASEYQDQVAVLMYHHISDELSGSATILPKLFRDQIDYLLKKGYHFISLEEFRNFMTGSTVPKNAVLVTFDDGYESFYTEAYPVLKEKLVPAVNFVITQHTDRPGSTAIPHLSSSQMREMAESTNFIDLQCHTNAMHYKQKGLHTSAFSGPIDVNGARESESEYYKRIKSDLNRCVGQLRDLTGDAQDVFAYPYGLSSSTAIRALKETGFRFAFTTKAGMATRETDPMLIPRINAGHPEINPEALHRTIQKHIVKAKPVITEADLTDAVRQLGGTVRQTNDGSIIVSLNGRHYTLRPGSRTVYQGKAKRTLKQKIVMNNRGIYIHFDDLQKMLDLELIFNQNTNKYSLRPSFGVIGAGASGRAGSSQGDRYI
jgi:peptidoglycan/xylan/chitin deacetylase (PgdA/CDA1 family)